MGTEMDRYGCNFLESLRKIGINDSPKNSDQCPDALSLFSLADKRFEREDSGLSSIKLRSNRTQAEELQQIDGIKDFHKIILVMESPHKDEFKRPIMPAKNKTGENVRKYLPLIFGRVAYYVALINSVQYQCSLGCDISGVKNRVNSKRKNEIFCKLLSTATYRESLKRRVREVYNPKHDILINCCTKGDADWHNKDLVFGIIHELLAEEVFVSRKFPVLCMAHPYWWFKNRDVWCIQNWHESMRKQDVKVSGNGELCFYSSRMLYRELVDGLGFIDVMPSK